jgi:hypothetical protein
MRLSSIPLSGHLPRLIQALAACLLVSSWSFTDSAKDVLIEGRLCAVMAILDVACMGGWMYCVLL